MKCKVCGGAGVIQGQAPGLVSCCPACNGNGFIEMTNEEWIKQCNTEQLVEEVYKLVWCSNELFQQMECSGIDTKENDLKIVTEWLKQPHTPRSEK